MADRWAGAGRTAGLRRFAIAITILNLAGHTLLGFEQAWLHPLVGLTAAYSTELLLEWVDARASGRRPRFAGGFRTLVDFLLSAHISGLAVSMLLYPGDRLAPVAFAAVVAIASKTLLRAPVDGGRRHVFNPSNLGIATTLLLFPSVGIAPPYQFTENVAGAWDWILPGIIVMTGSLLNTRFTGRVPLLLSWLAGFAIQAILRSAWQGTPLLPALLPMTSLAFLLYTFYMVTDPATTPGSRGGQVLFGAGVAMVYGLLMAGHAVFGLFFALATVTLVRAALLQFSAVRSRAAAEHPVRPSAIPGGLMGATRHEARSGK